MSSGVVICKSLPVVVKPSEPVRATSDISLSFNNMITGPMQVTVLFVFERPIQEPLETVKRGLARALVHYYPIAGCFAAGANAGEVVIRCTGQGVPFVAASSNYALKDGSYMSGIPQKKVVKKWDGDVSLLVMVP